MLHGLLTLQDAPTRVHANQIYLVGQVQLVELQDEGGECA